MGDVSFRHEVEHAITTGLSWLMAHQDEELAMRLINLQSTDGSWSNPNNHGWEKNPHLSTACAVLTLGLLWSQL